MPLVRCTHIQKAWDEKCPLRDLRIIPVSTGAAALFYGDGEGGGGGPAGWDLGRWCLEAEEEEGAREEEEGAREDLRRTRPRWEYHFFAFPAAEGCSQPLPPTHQADPHARRARL